MNNYIGLDVSLKTTSICIMNQVGEILQQGTVATDPKEIFKAIVEQELPPEKVALECGGMSLGCDKFTKRVYIWSLD
jgi:hypothetical protein